MSIKNTIFIVASLFILGCSTKQDAPQIQAEVEVGEWVQTPVDFESRAVDETSPVLGHCKQFDLGEGEYFVTAGPFAPISPNDDAEGYYYLSIERKGRGCSTIISNLKVSSSLVSPDRAEMELSEYVSFDSGVGLVSIDLGESSFRYKFVNWEG